MIEPPLQLVAFEYRRRLEGGVTRPLVMAAMDEGDREYLLVVKLRHPDASHERGRSFDKLHTRWRGEFSATDLDRVRAAIPDEWERRPGDLGRIFSFLAERPARFNDIQAALRRVLG